MTWNVLKERQKIKRVINYLILQKVEIVVRIEGQKTSYNSKFLKISSDSNQELIMENLMPENGNHLVQKFPDLIVEFVLDRNKCHFCSKYIGISRKYPYFGVIINFPESIKIEEKRKEKRSIINIPQFLNVEFKLDKGSKKDKVYELDVFDCSRHGLGLLVAKEDFELLEILDLGDIIRDMVIFAASAMIKVDCKVRHKSKIEDGRYKGNCILGVESSAILESCLPPIENYKNNNPHPGQSGKVI